MAPKPPKSKKTTAMVLRRPAAATVLKRPASVVAPPSEKARAKRTVWSSSIMPRSSSAPSQVTLPRSVRKPKLRVQMAKEKIVERVKQQPAAPSTPRRATASPAIRTSVTPLKTKAATFHKVGKQLNSAASHLTVTSKDTALATPMATSSVGEQRKTSAPVDPLVKQRRDALKIKQRARKDVLEAEAQRLLQGGMHARSGVGLLPGRTAVITELVYLSESLNGTHVRLLRFIPYSEHWVVKPIAGGETLNLRPANLIWTVLLKEATKAKQKQRRAAERAVVEAGKANEMAEIKAVKDAHLAAREAAKEERRKAKFAAEEAAKEVKRAYSEAMREAAQAAEKLFAPKAKPEALSRLPVNMADAECLD